MLHARAQGLEPERCRDVLGRITTAWGDGPGSWGRVWSEEGEALAGRGRHLDAVRHFALGRFPYVDGEDRARAQRGCVEAFGTWRRTGSARGSVERLELDVPGGRVVCWAAGLSASARRPLLVVLGGIVSVKEQWAPVLARAGALGLAVVVTEMPGVGENTLPYRSDSPRMLSAVLDAVSGRADTARTSVIALSFGGHLALRCALSDERIRGVATVGAPLALRVGLVTAAALGDALDVPVHGLCTLDGIAYAAGFDGAFVVATDARRKEVYWARYDDARTRTGEPSADRPGDIADEAGELPSVGAGALLYPETFTRAVRSGPEHVSAAALAALAAERLAGGAGFLPALPLYLRRPDARVPAGYKAVQIGRAHV